MLKKLHFFSVLLLTLSLSPTSAFSNEIESIELNKIEVTLPYPPGGGTDTWVRAVLPSLSPFLPGNEELLIKNVGGSNGTKAANEYARVNPIDGKSLLVTAAATHLAYLLGDDRARYDLNNWQALMASNAGTVVYVSSKLGLNNYKDLLDKTDNNLVMGSLGPASEDLFVLIAFDILNIDITSIFGLRGRGASRKMFEQGDTNLDFQTAAAYLNYVTPLVERKKAVPLFSLGAFDENMNYIRDPLFPELPNLAEVYEYKFGKKPSGKAWEAWLSLYQASHGSLKLVVLPKNTPKPIIDYYESAVTAMLSDQETIDLVSKKVGKNTLSGTKKANLMLINIVNLPDSTRQWIIDWIFQKYEVKL